MSRMSTLGFRALSSEEQKRAQEEYESIKTRLLEQLKKSLKPEFLNRVDQIVVFRPLTRTLIESIVALELGKLITRAKGERGIQIEVTPKLRSYLSEIGYEEQYGARPVRRAIEQHVESALADSLMNGEIQNGDNIKIDFKANRVIVEKRRVLVTAKK